MAFWSKMWELDGKLRRFFGLFLITPFCALSLPIGLFILAQSSIDYRRLEQHQVSTVAVVQSIAETGGRHNRNAVTSTFEAADGQTYVTKALYGIEGSKHVRTGMKLGIIYERSRPTNNAPTLAYAKAQIHDVKVFLGIMAVVSAVLALIYWRDYVAMFQRLRGGRHTELAQAG